MREYEQRFGKNLDEDVQDLCHTGTGTTSGTEPLPLEPQHTEEPRASQDDAVRPLTGSTGRRHRRWRRFTRGLLCAGNKGKGDKKGNSKGKRGKGEGSKGKKDKGKGNGKDKAKATACEVWDHMKKDCWWNESSKSGKDAAFLETPTTSAAKTQLNRR